MYIPSVITGTGKKNAIEMCSSAWLLMLSLGRNKRPVGVSTKRAHFFRRGKQRLSICGAIGSDEKYWPLRMGSFWKNEPILEGTLGPAEGAFHRFGRHLDGGSGLVFGLMLLNSMGGTLRRVGAMEGRLPVQHGTEKALVTFACRGGGAGVVSADIRGKT